MRFWIIALVGFLGLAAPAAQAEWRTGIAALDLEPPYAIPLGGFGYGPRRAWPHQWFTRKDSVMFNPHEGVLDRLRVKVMHLETGEEGRISKLLFVGMDVVAAPVEMRDALAERLAPLGYDRSSIILSGTHTHSGPGALTRNPIWVLGATDVFHGKFYDWWLDQTVEAVKLARSRIEPAEIFSSRFNAVGLQRNRRAGDHVVDRTAHALLARSADGRWLGGMVNLPIHGISLSEKNMRFSGDTPGAIEAHTERLLASRSRQIGLESEPVILFMNGAEGDVSPNGFGIDGMERMGSGFAEQLDATWSTLSPLGGASIEVRDFEVKLGRPRIEARNCLEFDWIKPWLKAVKLGVRFWFPDSAPLTQVRLGGRRGITMMSWPGEPTSELGLQMRDAAEKLGARDAWVLGLTNGHQGYFTSPWDFELGGLEACLNFYGREGGRRVVDAHLEELFK